MRTRWDVVCPTCHAGTGQRCTTPDGRPLPGYPVKFHTARKGDTTPRDEKAK